MFFDSLENKAKELGFDAVGVSPILELEDMERGLIEWIKSKKHGDMSFLERNIDKRRNPALLVENARSIIVVLANYYTDIKTSPIIARYALGKDYHWVLKKKMNDLLSYIENVDGKDGGRCFVDSAPIFEQEWGRRVGLGWKGKNTLLINRDIGSFFFIGVIISTVEFDSYSVPSNKNYCGKCTKCIDSCPTSALSLHGLEATKCIAYNTIENKGEYPYDIKKKSGDWIFGCDICQEVCPWNKKIKLHNITEFSPDEEVLKLNYEDWKNMTPAQFKRLFKGSPLERTGLKRIKRNLQ